MQEAGDFRNETFAKTRMTLRLCRWGMPALHDAGEKGSCRPSISKGVKGANDPTSEECSEE